MDDIVVDIGGTQLRAALYPSEGLQPRVFKAIPTSGEKPAIERLFDLIESIWPAVTEVRRIALAAPGALHPTTGITYTIPNIPNWNELHLVELVQNRFNIEVRLGNDANLAAIFSKKWPADYKRLKDALPPWTLFYTVAGYEFLPEERVASYIKDITDITQRLGVEAARTAGTISANEILKTVQQPSPEPYWKLCSKGACQDVFFLTIHDKLKGQIATMQGMAEKAGYPPGCRGTA